MSEPNPILVELTRGDLVESFHRGAIAIADADGRLIFSLGDVERLVYPRSSLKPLQALPLIESSAAAGLSDEEVALACASHSGEAMHTSRVAAWLARQGLSEADLACGPQAVRYEPTFEAMICAHKAPTPIHNNCSGKHAGFLTLAQHLEAPINGYERHNHPVQQAVARVTAQLAGVPIDMPFGIDGCAAPNFALPLSAFARALAQFADPAHQPLARGAAMIRIVRAMSTYPELVSGTGRTCAILMRAAAGRCVVKTGAEGVFAAIVPERRLGIALKIDDGTMRAADTAIAVLLDKLGLIGNDAPARALVQGPLTNTRDTVVGERRAAPALNAIRL